MNEEGRPRLKPEIYEWMSKNDLVMTSGIFDWAICHKSGFGTASQVTVDMKILEKDKIDEE